MRIGVATLAIALVVAGVQSASAYLEPFTSGSYYDEHGEVRCEGVEVCRLDFSPPPAGKQIVIKRISCLLYSIDAGIVEIYLTSQGKARTHSIEVAYAFNNDPFYHGLLNQDVDDYVATTAPGVVAEMTDTGTLEKLECLIAGRLANKP